MPEETKAPVVRTIENELDKIIAEIIVKKHDEVYWGSFYKVPAHRLVSQGITDNHELPQCKLGG